MLELPSRNIWSAYTQAGFKATSTEYMLYLVPLLYSTTSCSLTGENTIKPRSFQTTSSDAFPSHFTSTQSVRMTKCTTGKQILYIQILCIRATRCQRTENLPGQTNNISLHFLWQRPKNTPPAGSVCHGGPARGSETEAQAEGEGGSG